MPLHPAGKVIVEKEKVTLGSSGAVTKVRAS